MKEKDKIKKLKKKNDKLIVENMRLKSDLIWWRDYAVKLRAQKTPIGWFKKWLRE